jgi:DNA-binding transcriptional MerR regulator
MGSYTIREVEKLLQVKIHVLRYWEKEIPLIQPKKDLIGRLHYSEKDLQIFSRLKYLVMERHFTLEGAREELFQELAGKDQDLRAEISALRTELTDLYLMVKKDG